MKKRVTIKDIARLANVTPQAVSRALRDAPDISTATKERIFEIAQKLNYCKNSTASALRRGSTRSVAIVYDELKNVYYSIMIDFIQSYLEANGFSILTFSYRYSYLTKDTYMKAISHNVDAVISFLDPKEEMEELIENYHVPVLLFGRHTDIKNIDCIYTDDQQGGWLVAEKFYSLGCKRPVYFTLPDNLACVRDRFLGFERFFKEKNITSLRTCYKQGGFEQDFFALFEEQQNKPDCIFCFNDMMAFEALALLQKRGITGIPVIGYDNIQEEVPLPYRLTTVASNKALMVEHGIDLIVSRIDGALWGAYQKLCEPVFLVSGESA